MVWHWGHEQFYAGRVLVPRGLDHDSHQRYITVYIARFWTIYSWANVKCWSPIDILAGELRLVELARVL
jgi:hypothetical protein